MGVWGETGTSLSCSFSGGRLDSREIPGSLLPSTSPPSPTAQRFGVGLMLTHLKALSTGQPQGATSAHPI